MTRMYHLLSPVLDYIHTFTPETDIQFSLVSLCGLFLALRLAWVHRRRLCCCFCCHRTARPEVRDFHNEYDLLMDLEEGETGHIVVVTSDDDNGNEADAGGDEEQAPLHDNIESSLETIFPSILRKKVSSLTSSSSPNVNTENEGEQAHSRETAGNSLEEPLLNH